jgi:hypothetical protein
MEHREGGGSLPPDVHGSLRLNVLAGQRLKERKWFRSLRTNGRCQQLLGDESRQLRKHVGQSGGRRRSLLRRCRTPAILSRLLMQLLFVLAKIDLLQHGSALLANVMVHEIGHLLLESNSHVVSITRYKYSPHDVGAESTANRSPEVASRQALCFHCSPRVMQQTIWCYGPEKLVP